MIRVCCLEVFWLLKKNVDQTTIVCNWCWANIANVVAAGSNVLIQNSERAQNDDILSPFLSFIPTQSIILRPVKPGLILVRRFMFFHSFHTNWQLNGSFWAS